MADKSAIGAQAPGAPMDPPADEKDIEMQEQPKARPASPRESDVDDDSEDSENKHQHWYSNPLKRNPPPLPKERPISREWTDNLFSQAIFWWANGLLRVGYKRPLDLQDLPRLTKERHNKGIAERLDAEFRKRAARGDKHPLLFALNATFFNEFWFGGFMQLIAIVALTLSPLLLKYIIRYAGDAYYGNHSNNGKGIGLAIGVIAVNMLGAICINQWAYRSLVVGGMARGSLISIIYSKSQVISARAKAGGKGAALVKEELDEKSGKSTKADKGETEEGWSNGRVSNLMSTDTARINQACEWSQFVLTTPIQVIIALIQLVINLGVSALPGFALLMICGPGLYYVTRELAKRRTRTNKITDARVSLTQELLSSIRFVKYFAWEQYFLDKLAILRKKEIRQVQVLLGARSAVTAVAMVSASRQLSEFSC